MDSLLTVIQDSLYRANQINIPSMPTMIIRMIFSMIIVIGAIIGLFYLLKKINLPSTKLLSGNNGRVLDTLPITNKQSIKIIYLFNKIYILSENPDSIKAIDIIVDKNEVNNILEMYSNKDTKKFSNIFKKYEKKN